VFRLDKSRLTDTNGYNSHVNANGYPQIAVEYKWKMWNRNDIDRIQLNPSKVKMSLDDTEVDVLDKGGYMIAGEYRSGTLISYLDTEKPVTKMTASMVGYLERGDTVLDGKDGRDLVKCESKKRYNFNVEASDSCGVQVDANCYLLPHSYGDPKISCKGNIAYRGDNCASVPVRYEWKVCNRGPTSITTNQNKSKYRLDDVILGNVDQSIASNVCRTYVKDAFVRSCDRAKKLEINVQLINDSICKRYAHFGFELTITSAPSSSPTVSFMPSMSQKPNARPSLTPTSKPSSTPTSIPTVNPTLSSKPSSNPSGKPTNSLKPSSSPTAIPTFSFSPSTKPSLPPCGCSDCDSVALSAMSGEYSCGARIDWLQSAEGGYLSERDACIQVASVEFSNECAICDPTTCANRTPSAVPSSAPTPEIHCGCRTCTDAVLDAIANGYTCRARINWLRDALGQGESAACELVSTEYPTICGPECDPRSCDDLTSSPSSVPSAKPSDTPCGCSSCTEAALDTMAGDYSCGARIDWKRSPGGGSLSEVDACEFVADEFPGVCGYCNPTTC